MYAKKLIIIILTLTIGISCSRGPKQEWEPGDSVEVLASVFCMADGTQTPDKGAALYIFEDFEDENDYEFDPIVGQFVHKESKELKEHTIQAVANSKGAIKANVGYGQKCIIVIQSHAFPEQYKSFVFNITDNQSYIGVGTIVFRE